MAPAELPGLVALSLSKAIKMYPATGWIRANRVSSEAVLEELNELRKKNAALISELSALRQLNAGPAIADLDDEVEVEGTCVNSKNGDELSRTVSVTWRNIFRAISPSLASQPASNQVKYKIQEFLFPCQPGNDTDIEFQIDDSFFDVITTQFLALGLIETPISQYGTYWSITDAGKKVMFEALAIRKSRKP